MNIQKTHSNDRDIFLLKALLLLGFAWTGFVLALVGFFHAWIAWVVAIIFGIWLTRRSIKNGVSLRPSRELIFASIAFLFVAFIFSFFSTPSVFTGRDQGSFAEASIRLAQNHQLEFSTPTSEIFFKLHEPGRALNFPGFYYTYNGNLTTQFSLVYISWLALFFGIFGIAGLTIANGVLFFTFLFSFYLLSRLFLKTYSSAITMLFVSTSFVFMWFSKLTLSENMALPLAWISIFSLMLFSKKQRVLSASVFFLSTALLCFTRIEGIALLFVSFVFILINKETRNFITSKIGSRFFLPLLFLFIVFIANIINDLYFYKEIAKALLPSVSTPKATYLGELKNNVLPSFYTLKLFSLYGLLGFFVIGAIGVFSNFWKKEFHKLIPLLIIAPTFIYFFDSEITPDHPWMLRRFMFSLLPIAIFYSGLILGHMIESKRRRIFAGIIITILLAMNMPAFLKYLTFSENKNLLAQTQTLASQFNSKDLILFDQGASGDGWAMISGPINSIYKKNAVYFFNIQDLARIDTNSYDNIYLVAPNDQVSYYSNSTIADKLTFVRDYSLTTTKLDVEPANPLKPITLPKKTNLTVAGKIFRIEKN